MNKRSQSYVLPSTCNMYRYYIEKQLWNMSNSGSRIGDKVQSRYGSMSPTYIGNSGQKSDKFGSEIIQQNREYNDGSMNISFLEGYEFQSPSYLSDSISDQNLHQNNLPTNKKNLLAYLEESENQMKMKFKLKTKFIGKPFRKQKSLDNEDFLQYMSTSQVLSVAIQTESDHQTIIQEDQDSMQTQPENPRKSGSSEIVLDGNRFSFSQNLIPKTVQKQNESQVRPLQNSDPEAKCQQEKIKILERKILLLVNKIKIYDTVFQTQDCEITRLITKVNQFEENEKKIQVRLSENSFNSLKKIPFVPMNLNQSQFIKLTKNIQKVALQTSIIPDDKQSPTKFKLSSPLDNHMNQNSELPNKSGIKQQQNRNQIKEYQNNQSDRIVMLQEENKYLYEELLRVKKLNQTLNNKVEKSNEKAQSQKTSEDKLLSDKLYTSHSGQFWEVKAQLKILDQHYIENETINQLYKQLSQLRVKSLNFELECDRQKSINKFLHNTIQKQNIN